MGNKSKFLKGLLATASSLAVLTSGAYAAETRTAIKPNSKLSTAGDWNPNGAIADGDTAKHDNAIADQVIEADIDGRSLSIDKNGYKNNNSNPTMKILENTTVTEIKDTAAAKGKNYKFIFGVGADDKTLDLTGLTQASHDFIEVINFSNKTGIVSLKGDVDVKVNWAGSNGEADKGTIRVRDGKVTFSGSFAQEVNKRVKALEVTGGKTAIINTNLALAEDIILEDGAILTIKSGKDVTVRNIKGDNANQGTVNFEGASKLTGTIGDTESVKLVDFKGAGKVNISGAVSATDIKISHANAEVTIDGLVNANIEFVQSGTLTVKDVLTGNVTFTNADKSILSFTGAKDHKITGAVNAAANSKAQIILEDGFTSMEFAAAVTTASPLDLLSIEGSEEVTFSGLANIKKIDITDQNPTLIFAAAGDYKIGNLTNEAGNGILKITDNANLTTVDGKEVILGTKDSPINSIQFPADKTLTFKEKASIATTNGITTTTDNTGKLSFVKGGTVDSKIGTSAHKLAQITVGDAQTLLLEKDVFATDIVLTGAANLQLAGNPGQSKIKPSAATNGTLTMNNLASISTEVKLGTDGANKLKTLKINGADVILKEATDIYVGAIEFTNPNMDSTLTISHPLTSKVTTTSTQRNHSIQTTRNQTLIAANSIGTESNRLGNFILDGAVTLTINEPKTIFVDKVISRTNNTGTVTFSANNDKYNTSFGTKDNKLLALNINGYSTIVGDIYATTTTVADSKSLTFDGNMDTNLILGTNAAASIVTFADGASVNGLITGQHANDEINFEGGAVVNSVINAGLGKVNFKALKFEEVKLAEDITAAEINFGKATALLVDSITMAGPTKMENTHINLGTENLEFTDTLTLEGDMILNVRYDGQENGQITISGAGKNIDSTNLKSLMLVVEDTDASINEAVISIITAKDTATGLRGVDLNKNSKISSKSQFIKLSVQSDENGNHKLIRQNNSYEAVSKMFSDKGADLNNIQAIANPKNTGDAKNLWDSLAIAAANAGEGAEGFLTKAMDSLMPIVNEAAATENLNTTQNILNGRVGSFASQHPLVTAEAHGVAAGDSLYTTNYGAWVMPFYTHGNQKVRKGVAGFKMKTSGSIIGADFQVNDAITIGAAGTISTSKVTHKDTKAGDRTKVSNTMFSVYGLYQMANDWFTQGVASFGSGKVSSSEKRFASVGKETAKSRYDTMTYGLEMLVGYNSNSVINNTNVIFTPMVGISYSKYNDSGYKQTGTSYQNLSIQKQSSNNLDGVIGARVVTSADVNGVQLVPEIHGFVKRNLHAKRSKPEIKLDGMVGTLEAKTVKAAKLSYNLGGTLSTKVENMEYGIGYDAYRTQKYLSHQGTLKVRVNF